MGEKIKKFLKEDGLIYLIICISILCFWLPFIPKGLVAGAEIDFQYSRILTLIQSMQEGIFPPKVRPMHMLHYGYGVGLFYPDFFFYPIAFAAFLGADPMVATKVVLFLLIAAGGITSYRLLYKISGNRFAALVGEVLIMGSWINYENLIYGAGLPHLIAYLAIPLTIIGLLGALEGDRKGYIEYCIGVVTLVLSHHLIFFTVVVAMVIIVLVHIKVIFKNPGRIVKIIGWSIVGVVFTTAYWLPAVEQVTKFTPKVLVEVNCDVLEHILSFEALVKRQIGLPLSILFFLSVIAFVILVIKRRKMGLDVWSLFATNVVIIVMTCSKTLWLSGFGEVFSFFERTQRFIFVMTITMIIFVVMMIREVFAVSTPAFLEDKRATGVIPLAICLALILVMNLYNNPQFYDIGSFKRLTASYELLEKDWNVSGGEWVPKECEPTECKDPDTSRANDGSSADGFKHDYDKYYEVWVDLSKEYYDVPYVYYYGYRAYLVDDNMNPTQELKVTLADSYNGLVRVYMPEDGEGIGHIMVTYRKTAVQKISYVISMGWTLVMIGAAIFTFKKDKALHKRLCVLT